MRQHQVKTRTPAGSALGGSVIGSERPNVVGGFRHQSPERRPYRALLASCNGDGPVCGAGRRGLRVRADGAHPAATSRGRYPRADWSSGFRSDRSTQPDLCRPRRAHDGYLDRGASTVRLSRCSLCRPKCLSVLRLGRARNGLSRSRRLSQTRANVATVRSAVRNIRADCRITAHLRSAKLRGRESLRCLIAVEEHFRS